jgi:hypothetical protein
MAVTIAWIDVSPDSLPKPGEPVLLQLRKPISIDPKKAHGDSSSVLKPGYAYNFVTGTLVASRDGFGREHPQYFVALQVTKNHDDMNAQLGERFSMQDVAAWSRFFFPPVGL